MSPYVLGLVLIGLLLLTVSWGSEWIGRLPISYAIIYLVIGIILEPYGINLIWLQPSTEFLERFTEFVVIVSLYSCGLRISRSLKVRLWDSPIRLIGFLLPLSILTVAAVGHWLLQLPWSVAVLLGAILSPTDPVLASEVQLEHGQDPNELRFGLTSEGGLNDAFAFPFIYFGLYWIKDPVLDNWLRQWVAIDLVWAIAAAVGMGVGVAKIVVWINHQIQKSRGEHEVTEDLVAIGIILLTYALTEMINGYGFLAVFLAGYQVQKLDRYPEQRESQLHFITQLEKLSEVIAILLLGALLRVEQVIEFASEAAIVAGSLLFIIRPLGTWLSTLGSPLHPATRWLLGWFGIRGMGSIYYLSYAVSEGLSDNITAELRWITYLTVLTSIVLHGITAAPLVSWHQYHIGNDRIS